MKNIQKLIYENKLTPLLAFGIGFILAASVTIKTAIMMGISIIIISCISSLVIATANSIINEKYHIILYLCLISILVSIIQIILNRVYPNVIGKLGIHFSALCVSAVPYRLARKIKENYSIKDIFILTLIIGIIFLIIMLINSSLIYIFKKYFPLLETNLGPYFFLPLIFIIINYIEKRLTGTYERNYNNINK